MIGKKVNGVITSYLPGEKATFRLQRFLGIGTNLAQVKPLATRLVREQTADVVCGRQQQHDCSDPFCTSNGARSRGNGHTMVDRFADVVGHDDRHDDRKRRAFDPPALCGSAQTCSRGCKGELAFIVTFVWLPCSLACVLGNCGDAASRIATHRSSVRHDALVAERMVLCDHSQRGRVVPVFSLETGLFVSMPQPRDVSDATLARRSRRRLQPRRAPRRVLSGVLLATDDAALRRRSNEPSMDSRVSNSGPR